MGGSGLIGFLQILRLEVEGHPGLREQFWELARAASDTRDTPRRWSVFLALASSETTGCRLIIDNKKGGTVSPFVSRPTEPRG